MNNSLKQREVFHLAFLRQLAGKIRANSYALKGGVNLRFFFGSLRHSEDMDLDVKGIELFSLKQIVMDILSSKQLLTTLRPFNIETVIPPDIAKAKQTETTQRFKVHLINSAGEDLFTKIEFSCRTLDKPVKVEAVSEAVTTTYKFPPLIIAHYPCEVAVSQKIRALAERSQTQARDIFDIYMLLPQIPAAEGTVRTLPNDMVKKAREHVFDIDFAIFRDTVISYLDDTVQQTYGNKKVWEDIQLRVESMLTKLLK